MHVSFQTRYGMTLAGDLYTAKGADKSRKHPALIVGALYGGVREQGPCIYANELAQRWVDAEHAHPEYKPFFPKTPLDKVPADVPEPDAEWMRFYAVARGHHPHASGGFTTTSNLGMMNFKLLDYVNEISPRPILMIVGDRAHSKFFSETVYEKAAEPKELYVARDAEHIDLYDRTDRIPFDKLESFFKVNLK